MACPLRVRINRFPLYFVSEYSNFVWLKVGYPFFDQKYFLRAVFKGRQKHNFAIKDNFQAFLYLFLMHDVL